MVSQHAAHRRPAAPALVERPGNSFYAEVPASGLGRQSRAIDQIIGLAFDCLDAAHLEVRVFDAAAGELAGAAGPGDE